ncbi:hypothetical protein THTE_1293 [Thermogutta terrifontis]|uniref:Uncharacterized protein n=1 Tax=Thermogutta terrifontis TaxID=1331910 RepID=A0A286RD53_9BACT|nr:hypothetical protein THTE_1293 [Thermogutta terrifontis]
MNGSIPDLGTHRCESPPGHYFNGGAHNSAGDGRIAAGQR